MNYTRQSKKPQDEADLVMEMAYGARGSPEGLAAAHAASQALKTVDNQRMRQAIYNYWQMMDSPRVPGIESGLPAHVKAARVRHMIESAWEMKLPKKIPRDLKEQKDKKPVKKVTFPVDLPKAKTVADITEEEKRAILGQAPGPDPDQEDLSGWGYAQNSQFLEGEVGGCKTAPPLILDGSQGPHWAGCEDWEDLVSDEEGDPAPRPASRPIRPKRDNTAEFQVEPEKVSEEKYKLVRTINGGDPFVLEPAHGHGYLAASRKYLYNSIVMSGFYGFLGTPGGARPCLFDIGSGANGVSRAVKFKQHKGTGSIYVHCMIADKDGSDANRIAATYGKHRNAMHHVGSGEWPKADMVNYCHHHAATCNCFQLYTKVYAFAIHSVYYFDTKDWDNLNRHLKQTGLVIGFHQPIAGALVPHTEHEFKWESLDWSDERGPECYRRTQLGLDPLIRFRPLVTMGTTYTHGDMGWVGRGGIHITPGLRRREWLATMATSSDSLYSIVGKAIDVTCASSLVAATAAAWASMKRYTTSIMLQYPNVTYQELTSVLGKGKDWEPSGVAQWMRSGYHQAMGRDVPTIISSLRLSTRLAMTVASGWVIAKIGWWLYSRWESRVEYTVSLFPQTRVRAAGGEDISMVYRVQFVPGKHPLEPRLVDTRPVNLPAAADGAIALAMSAGTNRPPAQRRAAVYASLRRRFGLTHEAAIATAEESLRQENDMWVRLAEGQPGPFLQKVTLSVIGGVAYVWGKVTSVKWMKLIKLSPVLMPLIASVASALLAVGPELRQRIASSWSVWYSGGLTSLIAACRMLTTHCATVTSALLRIALPQGPTPHVVWAAWEPNLS